jgi:hypothetical protein
MHTRARGAASAPMGAGRVRGLTPDPRAPRERTCAPALGLVAVRVRARVHARAGDNYIGHNYIGDNYIGLQRP